MSAINDGGPAFPNCHNPNDHRLNAVRDGMSLREWFAGQILAGLCANPARETTWEKDIRDAVEQADALIAALAKEAE